MKILFFDIETVPGHESFSELSEEGQKLWTELAQKRLGYENTSDQDIADVYYDKAALYPEFGKAVCISIGCYHNNEFVTKSFVGEEEDVINDFFDVINRKFSDRDSFFCGHNIKGFDIKFVCRRARILKIEIPKHFNTIGKKPWEIPHIDTMELWKFGDLKDYTSLKLLCYALGVKTPKDDIHGQEVKDVYYKEKNIERITTYCEKDIVATKECYERMM